MASQRHPASIDALAFDCPHCGAYTSQKWFDVYADGMNRSATPSLPPADALQRIANNVDMDADTKKKVADIASKVLDGLVVIERRPTSKYADYNVHNLHLSQCFTCSKVAVWLRDRLVIPAVSYGPPPNPDLPHSLSADYTEAAQIAGMSPRGAAALVRLMIQKLCVELGERGRNIDDDIASLVKKGLSPLVQQALDAVRVIGNEAVHPGTLDLKDDVETAVKLLDALNIIVEQMISTPKHVKQLYDSLPEAKRKAIEKRDE